MPLLPTFLRARLLRTRLLQPLRGVLLFVPGVRDSERRGTATGQAVGELP